ncbi:30S ribosomal protein S20 [Treponema putidum]|uniref:Small ribosomal subunit protein bS20 n=1 Tax=Treponema putidum TaxID=221027 RepID=A0AAE9SJM0_9SPIR|nr:30S ribosomal protein S20 [Treponema putidum]AIN94493.1 30S ribosomal protein S20 [Treponema putidum]TWI78914.1 SSU ribosomal protein S20P [Treponema putidum]UTY28496.1 30S ribosomal protein S20 [Treponema putidum]UTY30945.1 30S ribosomal protein S20 [Treponema putidum]UTY33362.1 30S ribosomal protein S20 [Treponema putidum]
MKNRSAIKRHNQSEVRRMRNRSAKSKVRTTARKYTEAVHAKNAETAAALLRELSSQLDSAARKGILAKNSAARKKSRMQLLYNASFEAK